MLAISIRIVFKYCLHYMHCAFTDVSTISTGEHME